MKAHVDGTIVVRIKNVKCSKLKNQITYSLSPYIMLLFHLHIVAESSDVGLVNVSRMRGHKLGQ